MNHPTYLQWNCRGFKVNCNELSLLIQNYCPEALCLQETNFKETDKINIKNYIMYNCYAQTDRTSGGSSIAINNRYFHSQIKLKKKTFKQFQFALLPFPLSISLQTINLNLVNLYNLLNSFQLHLCLWGDFSAHNPLWGSDKVKAVEDVLSNLNLYSKLWFKYIFTSTSGQWFLLLYRFNNSRSYFTFRFTLYCTRRLV